jgi:tRNA (guanine37-N1)-methyltransferase
MVMKPEPLFRAVEHTLGLQGDRSMAESGVPTVLLSPQGRPFTQQIACELSRQERVVLICGRYEGVDERVRQHLITDEISIGDYVLSGGEIPAMVIVEAVTRLIPGVLGDPGAVFEDSHMEGLLEYPHYTRPPVYRGWPVPDVLLSGNHALVVQWRREEALRRTFQRRPELLSRAKLSEKDKDFLRGLGADL